MQERRDVTQEEIDAAIVACLRIFAARGRQLRLERERRKADGTQAEKEIADGKVGGNGEHDSAETPAPIDVAGGTSAPADADRELSSPAQEQPRCQP